MVRQKQCIITPKHFNYILLSFRIATQKKYHAHQNPHTHPERVLIEIRRLSLHHFYRHDTQRPNVHFGSVGFPGHHLWSHPVRGPHHGAAFALLWGDLGAEAEVSCRDRKKMSVKTNLFAATFTSSSWPVLFILLSLTDPSIPSRTLSLLMSLWMTWLAWRNSRAWMTWMQRGRKERIHKRVSSNLFRIIKG